MSPEEQIALRNKVSDERNKCNAKTQTIKQGIADAKKEALSDEVKAHLQAAKGNIAEAKRLAKTAKAKAKGTAGKVAKAAKAKAKGTAGSNKRKAADPEKEAIEAQTAAAVKQIESGDFDPNASSSMSYLDLLFFVILSFLYSVWTHLIPEDVISST